MPNDLPRIPGPSRAVYSVQGKQRKLFKSRRLIPAFGSAAPSASGKSRTRGTRRWPKRAIVSLCVLIVLVGLAGVGGYFYVDRKLGGIPRVAVPALTPEKAGQPVDILLVGSDTRNVSCAKTAAGAKAFGSSSSQTGQRSDVIIVARFVSATRSVEMLSIPRDTWVPIAGTRGSNKINAAFNTGPNQLVETIQDDFHIPINHVLMTNFCGFQSMVDSLGGIYLDFRYPVRDQLSGLNIKTTGCQLVAGDQALGLVRSRHLYYYDAKQKQWLYDGMSDWSRIRRQQAFFHSLLDRVHNVFPNIFSLNAFLDAAVGDLTLDSSMSSGEMISLGLHYRSLGTSSLQTVVLPTSPKVINGQDALVVPEPLASRTIAQFLAAGTAPQSSSTSSGSGKSGSGSSGATTTTAPSGTAPPGVVTDTPQTLPEPWNPTPC